MNKRYTLQDVLNEDFYQMPKFLFQGELKKLSSDAKILYMLLKDRYSLSLSNGWVNKQGQVYLIYTREDMAEMLGCSLPTVRRAVKQLLQSGLIEEERQGMNKANLIFLCYAGIENTWRERNLQSGVKESFCPEGKNLSPSKTNINNTNNNNNLHFLNKSEWEENLKAYIKTYLDTRSKYRSKEHKRVSDKNISFIKEALYDVQAKDITLDEFRNAAINFFEDIPAENDGDIVYFLKSKERFVTL